MELLNDKQLRVKLSSELEKTPYSHRSFDEILARLSGPVKSENGSPLASLKLSSLLNLSGKKTAELANAPEISGSFNEDDLKWYQHFFALPHWIAKTQEGFAKIYERQIRRRDERSAKVMQSIAEIPSLFVKGKKLGKKDMESHNRLVWEIEGRLAPLGEEKISDRA